MAFPARFQGTCGVCGTKIEIGEIVEWDRGAHRVWHSRCEPVGAATGGASSTAAPTAGAAMEGAIRIPVPAGLSYLPFQRDGISTALTRFRAKAQEGGQDPSRGAGVFLADEMG